MIDEACSCSITAPGRAVAWPSRRATLHQHGLRLLDQIFEGDDLARQVPAPPLRLEHMGDPELQALAQIGALGGLKGPRRLPAGAGSAENTVQRTASACYRQRCMPAVQARTGRGSVITG